ncbi:MAG: NfeD family protein, partial [Planctomycetia bacterium]
ALYKQLADNAAELALPGKYPEAVVRGLIDPGLEVIEVRNKKNPGLRSLRTTADFERPEVQAEWERSRPGPMKQAGVPWELDGTRAHEVDLAVANVESIDQIRSMYDVGERMVVLHPNWVDALVDGLTSSAGQALLLTLAIACLWMELQMPGFGLPALISAVCFTLFFWAGFLSNTANSLEVVLFLLGLLLLAVELFVLPGFGVTGLAGVALVLVSLVLASQSFVLPQTEAEARLLLRNVGVVTASLTFFMVIAATTARHFQSLPFFRRIMLAPPDASTDVYADATEDDDAPVHPDAELVGVVGAAVSPLRPAGRVKIGERTVDVVTTGEFIDVGTPVEIVLATATRIVVRTAPPPDPRTPASDKTTHFPPNYDFSDVENL